MRVTALSLEKKTKPGRAVCSLCALRPLVPGVPGSVTVSLCIALHMLFTFQHQHPQYNNPSIQNWGIDKNHSHLYIRMTCDIDSV